MRRPGAQATGPGSEAPLDWRGDLEQRNGRAVAGTSAVTPCGGPALTCGSRMLVFGCTARLPATTGGVPVPCRVTTRQTFYLSNTRPSGCVREAYVFRAGVGIRV